MVEFGVSLAAKLNSGDIIFLKGDLGAGKTTLSRGILQGLGHQGSVKSPTYTIVEPYQLGQQTIYHFDLYRLQDPQELYDMGFMDYLSGDAIVLIEWPEKASIALPKPTLLIESRVIDAGREVYLQG